MRGRAIPLSIHRRMVIDLLYFARGIPTVLGLKKPKKRMVPPS